MWQARYRTPSLLIRITCLHFSQKCGVFIAQPVRERPSVEPAIIFPTSPNNVRFSTIW